ncbi:MAG: cupin domain-containing protein [Alphaproteobacteria bacterium]
MSEADRIVRTLGLAPHPEGGHFRETWRDASADGGRGHGTAIYYLLKAGEESRWHRVDAAEIWHHYAGAPLALSIAAPEAKAETHRLGPTVLAGERPQILVPPHHWQSAKSLGDWTLVGCTVSPAFDFAGFEMAAKGWEPA